MAQPIFQQILKIIIVIVVAVGRKCTYGIKPILGLECGDILLESSLRITEEFPLVQRLSSNKSEDVVEDSKNSSRSNGNGTSVSVLEIGLEKPFGYDNTFQLLCTASYPVQWGFQKYQLYAPWTVVTGREFVKKSNNSTKEVFKSWLKYRSIRNLTQLRDDFPTCHKTTDPCFQTSVAVGRWGNELVITKGSKYNLKPDAEFGKNPNCSLRIAYDEETKTFYCQAVIPGVNVTIFPRRCSDPINCASVYQDPEEPCPPGPMIRIGECNSGNHCAKLTYASDYLPSVAVCLIRGSSDDSVALPFFYSLLTTTNNPRPVRYLKWEDSDPLLMMEIQPSETESFAGEKVNFSCNASYYYFGSGMQFELEMEEDEDSSMSSPRRGDPIAIPQYTHEAVELISNAASESISYEATTGKGVETQIPTVRSLVIQHVIKRPGNYKITCKAPVWNSTEWISKSSRIFVQESIKPVFAAGNGTETLFYRSELKIHCHAWGTPKPGLSWTLNDSPLPRIIKTSGGGQNLTDNWITLQFPKLEIGFYGNFTCTAVNAAGIVKKTFIVIPSDKSSSTALLILGILGALGLVLIPAVIFLFWKVRDQKKQLRYLTQDEVNEFLMGKPDYIPFQCDMSTYAYYLPYDTAFEIPKQHLQIDFNKVLGSGAYGVVIFGHYKNPETEELKEIAIKTSKPLEEGIELFKALLSELKIMTYIGRHENIVNLVGACTQNIQKREVYIALEFCDNGSLISYLRTHRHTFLNPTFQSDFGKPSLSRQPSFLDHPHVQYVKMEDLTHINIENQHQYANINRICTTDLLRWAHEIAEGMQYLATKKVIHGDLAARNVLLTRNLRAKIGDFGLSKRLMHYTSYTRTATTPLPIKWLAIECLQDFQFSAESDIWSYGVTLWELFSLGEIPYSGFNGNGEEFLNRLSRGMRLTQPIYSTPEIFDVMMSCWRNDRKLRPSFSVLSYFFKNSLEMPVDFAHPVAALRLSGAARKFHQMHEELNQQNITMG